MSSSELADNLTFFSALQMVNRLACKGLLTENEAKAARDNLRRKLRPTV